MKLSEAIEVGIKESKKAKFPIIQGKDSLTRVPHNSASIYICAMGFARIGYYSLDVEECKNPDELEVKIRMSTTYPNFNIEDRDIEERVVEWNDDLDMPVEKIVDKLKSMGF